MQFEGALVNRVDIAHTHHTTLFHIGEKRDLAALGLWNGRLRAAHQNIRLKPDRAQLFDRVLGWLCFNLTSLA